MTVKELKENLAYYDDDAEVEFQIDDEVEVDSATFDRYDFGTARVRGKLNPNFIGTVNGNMYIELEVSRE
jgi:hypothetical protein